MRSMADRIEEIRKTIGTACLKMGRKPEEVLLLAVSKTVDLPAIHEAFQAGISDFAENRVQELLRKSDICTDGIRWHLCGRLQTNKVRQLSGRNILIHSLDRIALAEEMRRVSQKTGERWQVLVEVNVAGEDSKAGVEPDQLRMLLKEISAMGCIQVRDS